MAQRSTWDMLNDPDDDPWGAGAGDYTQQQQPSPFGQANDLTPSFERSMPEAPDLSTATSRDGNRGMPAPAGETQGTGVGGWSDQDRQTLSSSYEQFLGRQAGDEDFRAHSQNPGGVQGAVQAVQGSPEAKGFERVSAYQKQVQQLGSTTDPQQRAVLQDQLARQVYSDLQGSGHDVKWDGDVLVVDGRRYTVGGGQQAAAGGGGGPQSYSDDALQAILHRYPPTNDGMRQAMAEIERVFGPGTVKLLEHPTRLDKLVLPDGRTIDAIIGAGGANPSWGWLQEGAHGGGGMSGGGGGGSMGSFALPSGAGGASAIDPGARPTAPATPTWTPEGQGYTSGEIPTENLPRASYEDLVERMGGYTPTSVESGYSFDGFDNMDAGTEASTGALVQQLLDNPESLPPHVVEMLKGASREELAQMAASLDQDLVGMGYGMGIDSSPWLASERLGAKRSRDEAIQSSNRGIDIEAAKTNMGDKRAAAQLGAAYGDTVARRNLATAQASEGNKQVASAQSLQAAMFNEQNVFNAATLQSNNAVQAARIGLDQAATETNRLALRESVAQAAAQLGVSRDKLMQDYVLAKASELMNLYNIDVSAYLDLTQLSTANSEWKEDLAFRLHALQEQLKFEYASLAEGGRQFNTSSGIDLAALQQRAREHSDNMQFRAYGL